MTHVERCLAVNLSFSHDRRQSTHSVGHAEGVAGRPVPTPPAHGIKDAAAGTQTELQLTSH